MCIALAVVAVLPVAGLSCYFRILSVSTRQFDLLFLLQPFSGGDTSRTELIKSCEKKSQC